MNKSCFRGFLTFVVLLMVVGTASSARAANQTDLAVALKTLPLLNNKISGSVAIAIVFDPSNADSKADADAIKTAVDAGIEAPGGAKITALMVPMSEAGSKLGQAKLAFITRGSCTDAVGGAATSAGVLSITTDLDCVKANKCILGVVSAPSVEIYFSKAAADAAKISFSQAFTMLVKQV